MLPSEEIRKFLAYALTGGVAALVDISFFTVLYHSETNPTLAAGLSFLIAAVVNYTLSSIFVFANSVSFRQFLLFLSFAVFGFTLNVSITVGALSVFPSSPVLAKMIGVGLAFFLNYAINRLIVFSRTSPNSQPS